MKAYKVFDENWICSPNGNSQKYEVGKTYRLEDDNSNLLEPILCEKGYHACKNICDCFSYYSFNPENKVAEVEMNGIILGLSGDKQCANIIKIVREISWYEVLTLSNSGYRNSGYGNSGDGNSGYRNSGDGNSGNGNSGNGNSGYRNSGNGNSGNGNSGNGNSGNGNSGDGNSGYRNSGYRNSGYRNSGNGNSGDGNSGYRNSGYGNSGNGNSGYRNSGDGNSGNGNSGYRNSGNGNSGNGNSGNGNSGHFNSKTPTEILVFNKKCKIKVWENAKKPNFFNFNLTEWIYFSNMTDEEKIEHPKAYVCDGYLKNYPYKEAWKKSFDNAGPEDIELLKKLPNFDAKVFEKITGIKIV